jgi:hypothetical protein
MTEMTIDDNDNSDNGTTTMTMMTGMMGTMMMMMMMGTTMKMTMGPMLTMSGDDDNTDNNINGDDNGILQAFQ